MSCANWHPHDTYTFPVLSQVPQFLTQKGGFVEVVGGARWFLVFRFRYFDILFWNRETLGSFPCVFLMPNEVKIVRQFLEKFGARLRWRGLVLAYWKVDFHALVAFSRLFYTNQGLLCEILRDARDADEFKVRARIESQG